MGEMASGGDCDEALRTLYYFLDGELTPARRQAIQRHLNECSPCLEAFDFEAELKLVVARCSMPGFRTSDLRRFWPWPRARQCR